MWLAQQEQLNVCGTGETPGEAVADAEAHIRHFSRYYSELPVARLTGLALVLKERYENVVFR